MAKGELLLPASLGAGHLRAAQAAELALRQLAADRQAAGRVRRGPPRACVAWSTQNPLIATTFVATQPVESQKGWGV
jgi:hypothetical protein